MITIEKFIQGKMGKEELCEDGICETQDYIAVIDGATSLSDFRYEDKKLGKLICDILLETIPKLKSNASCREAISFLNQSIVEFYEKNGILPYIQDDVRKLPAASLIMYSKHFRQIWLVGDCWGLMGKEEISNPIKVDELYTKIRVMTIDYLLKTGYTVEDLIQRDLAREFIDHLIKRQPEMRNKRFGYEYDYAVIDGLNEPPQELIKVTDVPEDVNELVFATDGYVKLFPTLQESEDFLKHVKEVDPLCYQEFAGIKGFSNDQVSYDDRAYIRFQI